jgi:hypothetical protein
VGYGGDAYGTEPLVILIEEVEEATAGYEKLPFGWCRAVSTLKI